MRGLLVSTALSFALSIGISSAFAQPAIALDADDIGGVVRGPNGPEAGVWVIAETGKPPARFIKIVVTDDQGRYVVPDLPPGAYKLWVRGYGLADSKPVDAHPGRPADLTAVAARTPKQAAEIYPANYWFSLIKVPAESEFPGTGPKGNGISVGMKNQQQWLGHLKENCEFCHQQGTKVTRELEAANSIEGWDLRVQRQRDGDDEFRADTKWSVRNGTVMTNNMSAFGRQRGLQMFADWTDRIAKGEVPRETPPRPSGVERNIVISLYDFADGLFLHDSSASDKRNPVVNANAAVFGAASHSGVVAELDPATGRRQLHKLTGLNGQWGKDLVPHTSTIDGQGRFWIAPQGADGPVAAYCADGAQSPFAKYFPLTLKQGPVVIVFDPKTGKNTNIPSCFPGHHLNFDARDRLYFSGSTEVVSWIDLKIWDATKDAGKAVGWCPMVLDTNGDGKIDADRTRWNVVNADAGPGMGEGAGTDTSAESAKAPDPKRDTRITGFLYGMGISPLDQSYWAARYRPTVPSGIVRMDPGAHPPETCRTEYYEPPLVNGKYAGFNARGVDVDANGVAWVAFGSGQIASFDRRKCKVTNGPTATGQQCPEGWEMHDTPGPKLTGTNVGSDFFYLTWVDHHGIGGLGKEVPFFPGSESDELLAYLPAAKQFVHFRVPYPLGFYTRGIDARVDDAKAGWKGRALWANNAMQPKWHIENGEDELETMVKFQLRPDPLAH